ncbi:MAG: hypothetical protein EAZ92_04735 [Candidatus Kapaibacterium sp.]|nr:MAG: hypothetical protein EAZ92_04735 [Candidatus Kapabacteria bacterium]
MSAIRNIMKKSTVMNMTVDTVRFLRAIRTYNQGGETPIEGVHSARHLFFSTNQASHKIFTSVQNFLSRNNTVELGQKRGILGDMSKAAALQEATRNVQEVGYHIFDAKLSSEECAELVEYARTTPSKPRIADQVEKIPYDRNNLKANLYDFAPQDLLENPIIQRLITDESILTFARELLGPSVRLHNVTMWWSNADFHNVSKNTAAQLYHVDMDTIKWIKIFFYLTDVGPENGPHCYIAKSHRNAPKAVYREGRIEDEEIAAHFPKEDIKEITGAAGTILAADTVGLHKGKPLTKGERLLFQLTFGITGFGYDPPRKITVNEKFSPEFLAKIDKNPTVYKGGYF